MNPEKIDGKEILYMDEVGDELTRPLTATTVDARVAPHLAMSEADDMNSTGTATAPEYGDGEADVKPHIGFEPRMGDGLSPGLLSPHPSEFPRYSSGETVLFPQPPIQVIPDVNVYQHKKTLAQGMMDLALLSANANQLRYVLQTDGNHPYYYPSLAMIGASLFLQIAVGIGLIWNSRYNVKDDAQMCKAEMANNWTVIGVFLVTILNVFISSFGVVDQVTATISTTAVAT